MNFFGFCATHLLTYFRFVCSMLILQRTRLLPSPATALECHSPACLSAILVILRALCLTHLQAPVLSGLRAPEHTIKIPQTNRMTICLSPRSLAIPPTFMILALQLQSIPLCMRCHSSTSVTASMSVTQTFCGPNKTRLLT